ncbi:MAG TPA: thioesterase family protein [Pirellulaceae bacterium]
MLREHAIEFRVRYKETDAQGRVHHANYFTYFEMGRVEQLRAAGYDYRQLEAEGVLLVIHKVTCHFRIPAAYDDLVRLTTRIVRITPARIEHEYRLEREGTLLATATSVLACVNREGQVRRMPDWMIVED